MKLIKGSNLNRQQVDQVLSAFIYRWTTGNNAIERVYQKISRPTIKKITDNQWLNDHAFWFVNDGSRLARNRNHAEPHYLAD